MIRPTALASRSAAALVVLALAGCAGFVPGIAPPKVTVIAVRLDRVEGARAVFAIAVELANPNATEVEITGLDATVTIEDQRVATAALVSPVRIPAGGTASADVVATAGMDAVLRAGLTAMLRGATSEPGRSPSLRYTIAGDAIFGGGLRVPFSRSGDLAAPR